MPNKIGIYEPTDRWIRAAIGNETIADSKRAMLMIESQTELDYYFPPEDIHLEVFEESDEAETSDERGTRKFWDLNLGDLKIEKAAWTYKTKQNRPDFNGYIAISWKAIDHWYEEEEEIYDEPRNPYYRVDTIQSSRHVEVLVDGVKLADTKNAYMVFETYLPTRFYIPEEDVSMDSMTPTEKETVCPYKGFANYYNVKVNGNIYENIVWSYFDPIPEAPKLKNTLAFWTEKDKRIQIFVDGDLWAK